MKASWRWRDGDGKTIADLMREDYAEMKARCGGSADGVRRRVSEVVSKGNASADGAVMVGDMVEAASGGDQVTVFGGHLSNNPNYWSSDRAICMEALADYGAVAGTNGVEYEQMKALFPKATESMDVLLEVLANGA